MTGRLWRNRDYMLLWGGQVVSTAGSAASSIVYPLLILALTDSPAAAGIAGALRALPYLVFSLPVGALIDRWDRKRVMILCDAGRALTAASIPLAMAFDALTLWQLYAATTIEGSLYVFFNIAEVAALPRVVGQGELPQAAAQNEAGFGAANIVGPSLGTFVYQTLGRAVPFVVDAVSYAVSIASLAAIRSEFRSAPAAVERHLRKEIADGLRWLWNRPLIRYMAFLTGAANLVAAATPLLVIVLARQLGATDVEIGVVFSIAGIGGILGSLVGGGIQRRFSFGQVVVAIIWVDAVLVALYAVAPTFWMLAVLCAGTSMTGPIYNVVQFSYRLALIPDALQGRVNSTFRLLAFGLLPIGAAISGLLLEKIGPIPTIFVFTLWYMLLATFTIFNRNVREARSLGRIAGA